VVVVVSPDIIGGRPLPPLPSLLPPAAENCRVQPTASSNVVVVVVVNKATEQAACRPQCPLAARQRTIKCRAQRIKAAVREKESSRRRRGQMAGCSGWSEWRWTAVHLFGGMAHCLT